MGDKLKAVADLDGLFGWLLEAARRNAREHGSLASIITGFNAGGACCHLMESPDATIGVLPGTPAALMVPAPFQRHRAAIRAWFARHGVTAAGWVAEVWVYPDGPEGFAAAEAFLAGIGPSPSRHPQRQEAATVFLAQPLAGYARLAVLPIQRDVNRITLGDEADLPDGSDFLSYATSWLEECLPAPDDRP